MQTFPIQPIQRFAGQSSKIRRPRHIAQFSYDGQRNYHGDASSLRYYYPPRLGSDLCAGFDTFQNLDDSNDEHLDALLKTIIDQEQKEGKPCEADIITWRGMMTKIMAAPFDRFGSFDMLATCFEGTIFIEENHSTKLAERNDQTRKYNPRNLASQDMMSYWGYKFETLSTIPDTWDNVSREVIEDRNREVVNNYAQYCSVVRTGIGDASLIIGGEVDAVWDSIPDDPEQPINWVELKTHGPIQSDADMLKFERKLLKFWCQSFLLGVPKIIVGFRSPDGILQRLEELETQRIPGNVKKVGKDSWDGNICINFTAAFLDFIRAEVNTAGVWRLQQRERSPIIEIRKIEEKGHGKILSSEFIEWRERLAMLNIMNKLG